MVITGTDGKLSGYNYSTTISVENCPQPAFTPAVSKRIACTPFPDQVVEKEIVNGMVKIKQKGTLTELKVWISGVLGESETGEVLEQGASVWVRSELFNSIWARDIFELGGDKFILVPVEQILIARDP